MEKIGILIMTLFSLPVIAVAGKYITDTLTTNNTFAGFAMAANITQPQYLWIPAFTRSIWWIIPIIIVVIGFVLMMRKDDPQAPSWMQTQPRMPSAPRMPKPTKKQMKKQQPPPPIFLGR
jgi:hypothetical protein